MCAVPIQPIKMELGTNVDAALEAPARSWLEAATVAKSTSSIQPGDVEALASDRTTRTFFYRSVWFSNSDSKQRAITSAVTFVMNIIAGFLLVCHT